MAAIYVWTQYKFYRWWEIFDFLRYTRNLNCISNFENYTCGILAVRRDCGGTTAKMAKFIKAYYSILSLFSKIHCLTFCFRLLSKIGYFFSGVQDYLFFIWQNSISCFKTEALQNFQERSHNCISIQVLGRCRMECEGIETLCMKDLTLNSDSMFSLCSAWWP